MADLFKEFGIDTSLDQRRYNLSLRAKGEPASCFEWDNPQDADGIPILCRPKISISDPNIKVSYYNFSTIQNAKASYFATNIERTYGDDISEDIQRKYILFDQLNNFQTRMKRIATSDAGWGTTYALFSLDRQGQVRFKEFPAWQAKVLYNEYDDPERGFIYYKQGKETKIHEYDFYYVTTYVQRENSTQIEKIDSQLHGFGFMPLVEFPNNDQRLGNAQKAVSLMDAYDRLSSDNVTEFSASRNAYLLLRNMGNVDPEFLEKLQKFGIITSNGENQEAKFVTKDINPEFAKFVEQQTWSGIWIVSNCVDIKTLSGLSDAREFQIQMLYGEMKKDCQDTENLWQMSFEYCDRILKSYWTGYDINSVRDYDTYSIGYKFNHNEPKDLMTALEGLKRAGGNLPQVEIFKQYGYSQEDAERLAEDAMKEQIDALPEI